MTKLSILAFSLLVAVGACSKGGSGKLEALKEEACACSDKACAEAVNKKLDAAIEDLQKEFGGKEPDEDTQKKLGITMMEAGLCLSKHMK